jgi:hypothetical protein
MWRRPIAALQIAEKYNLAKIFFVNRQSLQNKASAI